VRCGGGAGGAACSCWTAGAAASSLGALSPEEEAEKGGGDGEARGSREGDWGRRVGSGTWDAEGSLVGPHLPNRMRCFLPQWLVPRRCRTCVELFSLLIGEDFTYIYY